MLRRTADDATALPLLTYGLTAAMVALLGARLFWNWRSRIVAWHQDPASLLASPSSPYAEHVAVLVLGAVDVCLSLAQPPVMGTLIAACAAICVLTSAHMRRSASAGAFGLAMVPLVYIVLARAFVARDPARLVLGLAFGGAHLLWLARFWAQQLSPEGAWTTAGRLIPAARALSWAVGVLQAGIVAGVILGSWQDGAVPKSVGTGWLLCLATGAHSCLLLRDARGVGSRGSTVATVFSAPAFALGVYIVLPAAVRSAALAGAVTAGVLAACASVPMVTARARG